MAGVRAASSHQRRENNEGAIDVIDELSYSYDTDHDQPNQLMSVDDSRGVQAGFDNGNTSGDDYVYDANGNPTRDRNKGIESIEYNLLNLPTKITFNDNHYLTYLYDAAGIKLQQKEYRSDTLYKTTDYISSSIYVTMGQGEPVLQELMHDEGRIIPVILSDSEGAVEGYDYQYRLSDHLGNTRVIYSTNLEQYTMVEDFENGAVNGFTDLHATTDENANTTLPLGENNKTALLKSGETGALVFLHLNKGDTIDLQVNASYTDTPSDNTFASTAFSALFGTFNGTISGGEAPSALANEFDDALSGAAMAGKAEDTEAPRAYLNYILFDDDMNYVTAGFEPITEAAYRVNAGEHETVRLDDIIADQEGYLLAYLSNENQEQVNVYFDDFTVHQSKTNLVFASDYYPYGMPFNQYYRTASIGSRYQYQGKEYLEEEGLNLYDFHARYYDPALGRFTTVDPQNQFMTGYAAMGNNPVMMVDPDGELAWFVPIIIGAAVGGISQGIASKNNGGTFGRGFWQGALIGAAAGAAAIGVTAGLTAGASFGAIASGTASAGFGATVAGGAAGGLVSGGLGTAFHGGDLGQNLLNGAIGGAIGGMVPSFGGKGILPGAGLGALSGGLSGGITAELTGGNFGDGFKQGAIAGGISGGIYGGIAAVNSKYERNLLFGNVTWDGKQDFLIDLAKASGAYENGLSSILLKRKLPNGVNAQTRVTNSNGKLVTFYEGLVSQLPKGTKSNVYIKPASLSSMYRTFHHEMVHVSDWFTGKHVTDYNNLSSAFSHKAPKGLGIGNHAVDATRYLAEIRAWDQINIRMFDQYKAYNTMNTRYLKPFIGLMKHYGY